jgi:hypothetical protein
LIAEVLLKSLIENQQSKIILAEIIPKEPGRVMLPRDLTKEIACTLLFCPETPNSLVEQGRIDEGRVVLEKIRGTRNVDAEFDDLLEASNEAKSIKNPFQNLLLRKNRPQFIIGALCIPAFQQLTGNNSILFYAPVIFQTIGFGSGAALYSSVITSVALVLATLISMALVDKFGRRAFFLEAGAEMILCMVITYIFHT